MHFFNVVVSSWSLSFSVSCSAIFDFLLSCSTLKECQRKSKSCQWNNLAWKTSINETLIDIGRHSDAKNVKNNGRRYLQANGENIFLRLLKNRGLGPTLKVGRNFWSLCLLNSFVLGRLKDSWDSSNIFLLVCPAIIIPYIFNRFWVQQQKFQISKEKSI